jgi:hypothetical protein
MIGFMESIYYYSMQGCLRVKPEIISLAGQTDVQLPSLIAQGLSPGLASCRRSSGMRAIPPEPNSIWEPSAALPGSTWA